MFIGHYGTALAARRFAPKLSLGWYFLAAQVLDVFFSIFVLLGIENLRMVPGFTQVNDYDLYDMPYTHSLVGALLWACAAAAVVYGFSRMRGESLAFGAVVFSHFLVDVPVHTPDLPLLGNDSPKLGLGLWRHWQASTALELALLCIGLWLYWRIADRTTRARKMQLLCFAAALALLTVATPFLPRPATGAEFAVQALVGYFVLAGAAAWIDRKEGRPKS